MTKPMNWDDYNRGRGFPRQGSFSSSNSRVHFSEPSSAQESDPLLQSEEAPREGHGSNQELRRRRSSIAMAMGSLAQAGGVNSLENFARSWQRAVAFHEIAPSRSSFQYTDEEADFGSRLSPEDHQTMAHGRSLLRQQLEQEGTPPESVIRDAESPRPAPERASSSTERLVKKPSRTSTGDIFAHASHLSGSFSSSFGNTYGSLADRVNETSRVHAARLFEDQQTTGTQEPDKETEPLLLKRVEQEDGKVLVQVIGQSTLSQTVLNSTNVLIGVGLLSLPLAIKYAGWVVGLSFLTFSYLSTGYTAHLLGKCLSKHQSLITFVDLAYVAFGSNARIFIGVLFNLELMAASVALFILFADSLNVLIDRLGILEFKLLCGIIMVPLSFVPFKWLGYTSLLGIVCCFTIVVLVIITGLIKSHTPGSLLEPAATFLFPQSWMTLPLSFGLLMSPWGGHGVFPSIMRDMRHPEKYTKSLYATFNFTFLVDLCMAIVGLLMFGDDVRDEVTSNILAIDGYPKPIYYILLVCIAIIPLTKLPLNARPIFSTVENMLGLGPREVAATPGIAGMSGLARGLLKAGLRITVVIIIMIIAIFCPSFDRVMALMGSAFCFTICIILPCSFYLRLFDDVSRREKILCWFLIVVCGVMAILGTVWAFLSREVTGAR